MSSGLVWVAFALLVLTAVVLALFMTLSAAKRRRAAALPRNRHASSLSRNRPMAEGTSKTVSASTGEMDAVDTAPTNFQNHAEGSPLKSVNRASGVPDEVEERRLARIFISSTFRDMRKERQTLAAEAFPALKRECRALGIELQPIDLQWGVNEGDPTVAICLGAVRRSNWFVGLIGQRYGTTLDDEALLNQLVETYPSIRESLGRSLTELEMVEGLFSDAGKGRRALIFERDPSWINCVDTEDRSSYLEEDVLAQAKLASLRRRILERVGVIHTYDSPSDIGRVFKERMSEEIAQAFPVEDKGSDPFVLEQRLHAAFARERLPVYVGGAAYLGGLDAWMAHDNAPPKLIVGSSGGGKSTLIAQWTLQWSRAHPNDIIFVHYLGASAESADPRSLMRRLWLHLDRVSGQLAPFPDARDGLDELRDRLALHLAELAVAAARENFHIVIALDGLDKLGDEYRDLRWWPRVLPSRVKVLSSSLDGKSRNACIERGWSELAVVPLDKLQQTQFIADTLSLWNKSDLLPERKARVVAHAQAGSPLFLKSILDELRVSAANEILDARLDHYLAAEDIAQLYVRILGQIAKECGEPLTEQALALVWASRAGLEEDEIIAISRSTPLAWERLRNRLGELLRDVQGRVAFAHDYFRQAVENAFVASEDKKRRAHFAIADRFDRLPGDMRQAEELPYQLRAAGAWDRLEAVLLDLDRFTLLRARGDAELLSHWLPLKERGRDLDARICDALDARLQITKTWRREEIQLAAAIAGFLRFAGGASQHLIRLEETLLRESQRLFGRDHDETIKAMNNFAGSLVEAGQFADAQHWYEQVVSATHQKYGLEDPRSLLAMRSLAGVRAARGDLPGAQETQERVFEIEQRIFGSEHIELLTSMNNLSTTLQARGQLEAAQLMQEKVVELSMRTYGEEHPNTLASLNNMGLIHYDRGNRAAAREMVQRALDIRRRVFGPDHIDTLTSLASLANIQKDVGELSEAEENHEFVLQALKRLRGPEHPNTLAAMSNLAAVLYRRGDLGRAQDLRRHVMEERIRLLGGDHPSTLTSMDNYAISLSALGDHYRAQKLRERVVESKIRVLGPEHPSTLMSRSNLAATLAKQGSLVLAIKVEQEVCDIRVRVLGQVHPETLQSMSSLARYMYDRDDVATAVALNERVLEARQRHLGPTHVDTLTSMNDVAVMTGDSDRACELHTQVVAARKASLGPRHPETLASMNNLAVALYKVGRAGAAQSVQAEALSMSIEALGIDHPISRIAANNWAVIGASTN